MRVGEKKFKLITTDMANSFMMGNKTETKAIVQEIGSASLQRYPFENHSN